MISGGTVTLQSSRDSRGEKFLRACRINNKSKAITTLNQLYEENVNVIHYHGAFNVYGVHISSRFNSTVALDWLLDHNADFTALTHPKKQNCAHVAAELGNVDALAWLIEHGQMHGVDFNAKDAKGRTPLDVATLYNKTEAIKCIENMQSLQTLPHLRQVVIDGKHNGTKEQNLTSMSVLDPMTNRLSQLDVVLALENLRSLHEEELESRKKKEEETFWEISQLKEEVRDLKALVKSLISKLKDNNNNKNIVGDISNDVTLDSYLHEVNVEQANKAIDNPEELNDVGEKEVEEEEEEEEETDDTLNEQEAKK